MSIPEHTDAALDTLDADLAARLRFVLEADSLKSILRRNFITDGSRRENSGEHSWHLALMALVLAPCSGEPIDVARVIEMLVVHDLVEIDAGDTFVYDDTAREQKEELELRAADRLFAMLPADDALRLRARWDEFEASATPEARFAHSVDRLAPLLLNHANRGNVWAEHGVTARRARAYNAHIAAGAPDLWTAARALIDDAVRNEWIAE